MRKTLAVALITLVACVPVLVLHPPYLFVPAGQPAQLSSVVTWWRSDSWFGGLSGIETGPEGRNFFVVTDRGHMLRGQLAREAGKLTGVILDDFIAMRDRKGRVRPFPHTDAEGLALLPDGTLFVSFEQADRVLRYDHWDAPAKWPSYTRAWRALGSNTGLEALAVEDNGTLYTIPEGVPGGAGEALVYRRYPGEKWSQPFTLVLTGEFKPVGADIGPDGMFYLLERDFRYGRFRSLVRRFPLGPEGFGPGEYLLVTPLGRHGNLEGLSVWRDAQGDIRLTMVADDNFMPLIPSQIVEYIIKEPLAAPRQ